MLVYRDNARERSGGLLARELARSVARSQSSGGNDASIEALLRAGEIESALADLAGAHDPRSVAAIHITDALAKNLLSPPGERTEVDVAALALPERLRLTTPEGYAYYGLDPQLYAELAAKLQLTASGVAIIGIRSIGTSLSAIVRAALMRRQVRAERISVRPTGHPWKRTLALDANERAFVRAELAREAEFVIVDEGPGLSGSTFLAVVRALEQEGVPATRITLLCSHTPDPERLTGPDAAAAFRRLRIVAPPPRAAPPNGRDLSAGVWRKRVFGDDDRNWPVTWTQLERIKYLSEDGRWLDKFEGYAPYSVDALERAHTLATAGFAPQPTRLEHGFVRYPWLDGRPATREDLERGAAEQIATYCAFRTRAFRVDSVDPAALPQMLRSNVLESAGVDLGDKVQLEVRSPVVPDARMHPYEWRFSTNGRFYKLDGHGDGDAHLLPGPTDVCWDLAGAIVEWRMNSAQQAAFVQTFERLTGDRVSARLPGYVLAYTALRVGVQTMGLIGAPAFEVSRIQAARTRYGRKLERLLRNHR